MLTRVAGWQGPRLRTGVVNRSDRDAGPSFSAPDGGRLQRADGQATISAVIPTYNRRPLLKRALRSVLHEEDGPDEIIVVDDGSCDGTFQWLSAEFDAVRVIRQENAGVSAARRRGVEAARGDWIAFLDSDDEWAPGRVAVFRSAIARLPGDIAWIFGDTRVVRDHDEAVTLFHAHGLQIGSDLAILDDALPTQYPFQFSLLQSSVIRRDVLLAADGFSEGLRSSEDFLVSFQLALDHRFAATPSVVTRLYRTSDLANSSLEAQGKDGPDYFQARVIAFEAAIRAGSGGEWRLLHEQAVRGWCKALSERGAPMRGLLWRQFRHGASLRAVAFSVLALCLGRRGVACWNRLARMTPSSYAAALARSGLSALRASPSSVFQITERTRG